MVGITIRDPDDDVKARLRIGASSNGRWVEEEARVILREAVDGQAWPESVAGLVRGRFARFGGVDPDLPPREPVRDPPGFGRAPRCFFPAPLSCPD